MQVSSTVPVGSSLSRLSAKRTLGCQRALLSIREAFPFFSSSLLSISQWRYTTTSEDERTNERKKERRRGEEGTKWKKDQEKGQETRSIGRVHGEQRGGKTNSNGGHTSNASLSASLCKCRAVCHGDLHRPGPAIYMGSCLGIISRRSASYALPFRVVTLAVGSSRLFFASPLSVLPRETWLEGSLLVSRETV